MDLATLLRRIRRERTRDFPRISVYRTRAYSGVLKAMVAIVGTRACWRYEYGGCTMCPYPQFKPKSVNVERDLKKVLEVAEKERPEAIMLYSSGSVLDEREVPFKLLKRFIESLPSSVREIYLESRPEFVDSRLSELDTSAMIFPAIGLESSNDIVRLYHVRKGFTRKMFLKAVENAKRYAAGVKAYVLLKPPMMIEEEALFDLVRTLEDLSAIEGVKVVSVNPVHADPGTLQRELMRRGLREPPSFCSLFKGLLEGFGKHYVLISEPLKAGKPGGIRPCRDAREELKVLKEAVRKQDPDVIRAYLDKLHGAHRFPQVSREGLFAL